MVHLLQALAFVPTILVLAHATRTVPSHTVHTLRSVDEYVRLANAHSAHALFFFDPQCALSAQHAPTFTSVSRHLIGRDVLPIRINAADPQFSPLLDRFNIGGTPKFIFRNETDGVTTRFGRRGVLKDWLRDLGHPHPTSQYTLSTSHELVNDPRQTHVVLFLNPHANSPRHMHTLRAFRRSLLSSPNDTIHHFYTHFDAEHHHLLNEFGLLQHTGHPDYQHDRIVIACRDPDDGHIVKKTALDGVPSHELEGILKPLLKFCGPNPEV